MINYDLMLSRNCFSRIGMLSSLDKLPLKGIFFQLRLKIEYADNNLLSGTMDRSIDEIS
jgi:hypothetical protein